MYHSTDSNGNFKHITRAKARVTNNADPDKNGKVRVFSPVVGETEWIPYLRSPGIFDIPRIGDIVYIECEHGEIETLVAWGNLNTAVNSGIETNEEKKADGSLLHTPPPGQTSDAFYYLNPTDINFGRVVPTNRGMFSPTGHTLELDDGISKLDQINEENFGDQASLISKKKAEGLITPKVIDKPEKITTQNKGIRLTTSNGRKVHLLEDEDNSIVKILIEDAKGNKIEIDEITNDITIFTKNDYKLKALGNIVEESPKNKDSFITGNIVETCANKSLTADDDIILSSGGLTIIQARNGEIIRFNTSANNSPGNVVTDNVENNDPITGIPLIGNLGTKITS